MEAAGWIALSLYFWFINYQDPNLKKMTKLCGMQFHFAKQYVTQI